MPGAVRPLAPGRGHKHSQTLAHTRSPGLLEAGGQVCPHPRKAPSFSQTFSIKTGTTRIPQAAWPPRWRLAGGQLLPRGCVPAPCREGNRPLSPHPWVLVRSRTGRSFQQRRKADRTWGPTGADEGRVLGTSHGHGGRCVLCPPTGSRGPGSPVPVQESDGARASGKDARSPHRSSASAAVAQGSGKQGGG